MLIEADPEAIEIDALETAILVVDMQNTFMRRGGYLDLIGVDISAAKKIIVPCQKIVDSAHGKGFRIIYLQMEYSLDSTYPDSPSQHKSRAVSLLRQRPEARDKLYLSGTWGAEIIEELKPKQGDIVIKKSKHDGFIGTNLDLILRGYGIRFLIFIGIATNICVESTLRHAFSLGYSPILVKDAVTQKGPSFTQEATLFNVQSSFGWVTTSEEFLNSVKVIQNA